MRFANSTVEKQIRSGLDPDTQKGKLFAFLEDIVWDADRYAQEIYGIDLMLTSVWRPFRPGETKMHSLWRAIDAIWSHPTRRPLITWNDGDAHAIAGYVNRRWTYDPYREQGLLVALYAPHKTATGPHIHFQIHPNTCVR